MFGSSILDVIIGLSFTYFILGILTSQVNSFLSEIFSWKQKHLQVAIAKYVGVATARELVVATTLQRSDIAEALSLRVGVETSPERLGGAREDTLKWFDTAMTRASETYKKWMHVVSFVVGTGMVVALGVDSLTFSSQVWQTQKVSMILSAASSSSGMGNLAYQAATQAPFPWGWTEIPVDTGSWILKILGLGLSVLAVSLGAPVWYNFIRSWTPSSPSYGPSPGLAPTVYIPPLGPSPIPPSPQGGVHSTN
jgi:hypothetical protein